MTTSLEARIQRLEDRNAITEVVIGYATTIDRGDWVGYGQLFTDPVHIDFSEAGMAAADFPRDAFVGFAEAALSRWTARQHLSPNHVVVFDDDHPDTAVCYSSMYAQHHAADAPDGGVYLMRGSYDHHLVRTPGGWKITSLTQHIAWTEGDPNAAAGPADPSQPADGT